MKNAIYPFLTAITIAAGAAYAGPVDINRADAATLAKELEDIGESRAKAIVEYREKHGPYKSADDLGKIKGIGAKAIEKNRANIRVGDAAKK